MVQRRRRSDGRHTVVKLDSTAAGGELVAVLVDGSLVYAENAFDEEDCNLVHDAGFVAAALASALGARLREVVVPESADCSSYDSLLAWFKNSKESQWENS